ncbi:MAG: hypothetical protein ABIP50_03065 [Candidatus Saccharimonadales bacterium]
MSTLIQFRRDTQANWASVNPILAQGELGLVTDTGAYKMGDGTNAWNTLPYHEITPAVQTLTFSNQVDPSTPAAGTTVLYSRTVAGRSFPKYIGPSGLNSPLQPAIFQNSLWLVQPNTTSSVSAIGGAVASAGTLSTPTPNSTSFGVSTNFLSGAVANNTAGTSQNIAPLNTSSGVASNGGFFFVCRLWYPDANYGSGSTGSRHFIGLSDQTFTATVTSDNPAGSRMGFAMSTNLGETTFQFSTKNGTAETRTDTGVSLVSNNLYDFYIFLPAGGTTVSWRIDNLSTSTITEGDTTSTIPGTSTYLRAGFQLATLTTVARNVRMKKIYVETDN